MIERSAPEANFCFMPRAKLESADPEVQLVWQARAVVASTLTHVVTMHQISRVNSHLVVHVESVVLQVRLENIFGAGRDDIVQGGNVGHATRHAHRDALNGIGGSVEGGGGRVVDGYIDTGHNLRSREFRLQQIAVGS